MIRRMCMCVYYWVALLYSRKLTEHCKPTIMGKKTIKRKKKKLPRASGTANKTQQPLVNQVSEQEPALWEENKEMSAIQTSIQ